MTATHAEPAAQLVAYFLAGRLGPHALPATAQGQRARRAATLGGR